MPNNFDIDDLRPALSHCTHLIYRYARTNVDTHGFDILFPIIETRTEKFLVRLITHVKKNFPDLKVYLGIGGNHVPYEKTFDYLFFVSFIEVSQLRTIVTYSPVRNISDLFHFSLFIYFSYLIDNFNEMTNDR